MVEHYTRLWHRLCVFVIPTVPGARGAVLIRSEILLINDRLVVGAELDMDASVPCADLLKGDPCRHAAWEMARILMPMLFRAFVEIHTLHRIGLITEEGAQ